MSNTKMRAPKKVLMMALHYGHPSMSADHPYTIDWEEVYASFKRIQDALVGWSPKQVEGTSSDLGTLVVCEAFRMHEKALNARDWDSIDATFRQLWRAFEEYDRLQLSKFQKRFSMLELKRKSGEKGGRPGHDWAAICRDYDAGVSSGELRYKLIARLARTYDISKELLNRGLRKAGRGAHSTKTPHVLKT